jgi:four helix bundle protein
MEQDRRQYSFRNLALWQRGQELALRVVRLTERLPNTAAARSIARQVVASSGSIPANIAEGHGRFSVAAYRNHLSIARGSACETATWIDLLSRAGYIDAAAEKGLTDRCNELIAGLTSQMRALERKLKPVGVSKFGESAASYGPDFSVSSFETD